MRFKPVNLSAEGIEERAKMIFREAGDSVVGYKIKVYKGNLPLFDSDISDPKELIISAIADPSAYKIR